MGAVSDPPDTPQVRVLGPVEVSLPGRRAEPGPELVELVVLLSVHPEGLSVAEVGAALWPRRDPALALADALALLDRAVGWLGDDGPALAPGPATQEGSPADGTVRLVPSPGVDSELFRRAVRDDRPGEVLELLRGPVLARRPAGRYPWAVAVGLEHGLPALVVDTCARLSQARRRDGDPAGARVAAEAGLRVVPHAQRLWRELLRAEAAAGRHARVAELVEELAALLARALPPYDRLELETRALAAELRRERPAGAPPS